jgi:hypothetical protein
MIDASLEFRSMHFQIKNFFSKATCIPWDNSDCMRKQNFFSLLFDTQMHSALCCLWDENQKVLQQRRHELWTIEIHLPNLEPNRHKQTMNERY